MVYYVMDEDGHMHRVESRQAETKVTFTQIILAVVLRIPIVLGSLVIVSYMSVHILIWLFGGGWKW